MKFGTALVAFLAAVSAGGGSVVVEAFSPKGFATNKAGLLVPPSVQDGSTSTSNPGSNNSPPLPLWRPPSNMDMVAGGAERAAGQEYYEGACTSSVILDLLAVWRVSSSLNLEYAMFSHLFSFVPPSRYIIICYCTIYFCRCSDWSTSRSSLVAAAQSYRVHWYATRAGRDRVGDCRTALSELRIHH